MSHNKIPQDLILIFQMQHKSVSSIFAMEDDTDWPFLPALFYG